MKVDAVLDEGREEPSCWPERGTVTAGRGKEDRLDAAGQAVVQAIFQGLLFAPCPRK